MQKTALDHTFFALSHPVRRHVLERLAGSEMSVAEVSSELQESPSQMTKHLAVLEKAGLLSRRRLGRVHRLKFEPEGLTPVLDWTVRQRQFWSERLDALEAYLERLASDE